MDHTENQKEQNQELVEKLIKVQQQENIISNIFDSYKAVFNFMYSKLEHPDQRKVDEMMENIKGLKS